MEDQFAEPSANWSTLASLLPTLRITEEQTETSTTAGLTTVKASLARKYYSNPNSAIHAQQPNPVSGPEDITDLVTGVITTSRSLVPSSDNLLNGAPYMAPNFKLDSCSDAQLQFILEKHGLVCPGDLQRTALIDLFMNEVNPLPMWSATRRAEAPVVDDRENIPGLPNSNDNDFNRHAEEKRLKHERHERRRLRHEKKRHKQEAEKIRLDSLV